MSEKQGVFVTGTDTGVGKTVACACLVRAWDADYWKPLQTGLAAEPGDAMTVAELTRPKQGRIHASAFVFQAPRSPYAAAALENAVIPMKNIVRPASARPIVVEGAGGLMVPIEADRFIIDLIVQLGLPAILVARTALGTINHTLLSLEALRRREIPFLGVVMVGPPDQDNRAAIESFGRCPVIAELPLMTPLDRAAVERMSARIPSLESLQP